MIQPRKWSVPLGSGADVQDLPDDDLRYASFSKIFPQITQVPLPAGGVAPRRIDFNSLFKLLADNIYFYQNGGVFEYSDTADYERGALVRYDDNIYLCIQDNSALNVHNPEEMDYWLRVALSNELSDYLPLAGGNITGNLSVQNKNVVRTVNDVEADVNGNVVIESGTSLIPNQIIISPVPLTDANLHLLDGALLSGSGAYSAYVDLIAELYNGGTASTSFCTEAEWQTSNTNYGFCNKFVYDSVANTVRLPKINSEHGALIKSYSSGASWYRIYQDGWCEQGGVGLSGVNNPISYHIAYINKPFVQMSPLNNFSSYLNANLGNAISTSTSSFIITLNSADIEYKVSSSANNIQCAWFACGYIDISGLQTAPIYEYIVVGTVSKTDIQIDIDNVMADLANKAEKDFSNVTNPVQAFKDMVIGWSLPDFNSAITITSPFTAPTNGYLFLSHLSNNSYGSVTVNGTAVITAGGTDTNCDPIIFPVLKNDYITFEGIAYGSGYKFVPLKGV